MESKASRFNMVLLPSHFKKIGLGLFVLTFIFGLTIKTMDVEFLQSQKDLLKITFLNIFLLGLACIAFSRDKTEDEMTVALRLKAIAGAFGFEVLLVVTSPYVDFLVQEPIKDPSGQQVVFNMLIFYLLMYYGAKSAR